MLVSGSGSRKYCNSWIISLGIRTEDDKGARATLLDVMTPFQQIEFSSGLRYLQELLVIASFLTTQLHLHCTYSVNKGSFINV